MFNAPTYNGSFAAFNFPPLNSGLAWNTSRLNVDGSLWVVTNVPPVIKSPALSFSGSNLTLSSTGGAELDYYVLASTNATLPFNQWTRIATNTFDASGNFSFTNTINPSLSQIYLGLQQQ